MGAEAAYRITEQHWQYLLPPPSFTKTDAPRVSLVIYGTVHWELSNEVGPNEHSLVTVKDSVTLRAACEPDEYGRHAPALDPV